LIGVFWVQNEISSVTGLHIDLDHFVARVLQDALTEATAQYWLRRTQAFEQAAPRPGEYNGNATPEELRERWKECVNTAKACRRHAQLLMSQPEEISDEVRAVLEDVA
jgi:hypothetical protein